MEKYIATVVHTNSNWKREKKLRNGLVERKKDENIEHERKKRNKRSSAGGTMLEWA